MNEFESSEWLTPAQFADKHDVSYRTITRAMTAGELAFVKRGEGTRAEYRIHQDTPYTPRKAGRPAHAKMLDEYHSAEQKRVRYMLDKPAKPSVPDVYKILREDESFIRIAALLKTVYSRDWRKAHPQAWAEFGPAHDVIFSNNAPSETHLLAERLLKICTIASAADSSLDFTAEDAEWIRSINAFAWSILRLYSVF